MNILLPFDGMKNTCGTDKYSVPQVNSQHAQVTWQVEQITSPKRK